VWWRWSSWANPIGWSLYGDIKQIKGKYIEQKHKLTRRQIKVTKKKY